MQKSIVNLVAPGLSGLGAGVLATDLTMDLTGNQEMAFIIGGLSYIVAFGATLSAKKENIFSGSTTQKEESQSILLQPYNFVRKPQFYLVSPVEGVEARIYGKDWDGSFS